MNMKLEISLKQLVESLLVVSRAVASRPQLPVLSNILIEAEPTGVRLSATDLEFGVSLFVPGKVEKTGRTTVPGKMLVDYVSSVVGDKIVIEESGGQLNVAIDSYKASFATIDASEFPKMTSVVEGGGEVELGGLSCVVEKVIFACAKDSLRPVLTGVLFELTKTSLKAVATDGFRLAMASMGIKNGPEEKKSFILPARAVSEVAKLFAGGVGRVVFVEESNQVAFCTDGTTLLTQVIEGNYPDYTRILPKSFEMVFRASREELLQAVKAVNIFARDNSNVMRWSIKDGELVASGEAQERGRSESSCSIEVIEGDEMRIVFNAKYIMDFLSGSGAESVQIGLGANLAPGSFRIDGDEDYLYVVMPINA